MCLSFLVYSLQQRCIIYLEKLTNLAPKLLKYISVLPKSSMKTVRSPFHFLREIAPEGIYSPGQFSFLDKRTSQGIKVGALYHQCSLASEATVMPVISDSELFVSSKGRLLSAGRSQANAKMKYKKTETKFQSAFPF